MVEIQRQAYKEMFIGSLKPADFKVSLHGTVVSMKDNGFLLADGTGELSVTNNGATGTAEQGKFVRVFGRIMPYEEGLELQADIIQARDTIDQEALKKIIKELQEP